MSEMQKQAGLVVQGDVVLFPRKDSDGRWVKVHSVMYVALEVGGKLRLSGSDRSVYLVSEEVLVTVKPR